MLFVASASATPADDLTAVAGNYFAGNGHITPCRFSKAQLQSARSLITPDVAVYAPDFGNEVDRQIARWTSGACSSGGAGGGGGQSAQRATIVSLKVAHNRRSVKVTLHCPTAASSSCKVTLSGKLGGKKATSKKSSTVSRGSSKSVTVKLTKSATHKLKKKGGKLKISAKTAGSSVAATGSVKVAH